MKNRTRNYGPMAGPVVRKRRLRIVRWAAAGVTAGLIVLTVIAGIVGPPPTQLDPAPAASPAATASHR